MILFHIRYYSTCSLLDIYQNRMLEQGKGNYQCHLRKRGFTRSYWTEAQTQPATQNVPETAQMEIFSWTFPCLKHRETELENGSDRELIYCEMFIIGVDEFSLKLFPLLFIAVNLYYWLIIFYFSHSAFLFKAVYIKSRRLRLKAPASNWNLCYNRSADVRVCEENSRRPESKHHDEWVRALL